MKVHNQINRGEVSETLKRALGITKPEPGVERFSETLDPVINPWGMPEWAYLRGEGLCAYARFVPANAANFSGAALVNPVGSGMLVVLEAATGRTSGAAIALQLWFHSDAVLNTLAASSFGSRRDRRLNNPSTVSRCIVRYGDLAAIAAGSFLEEQTHPTAGIVQTFVSVPAVLRPGDGVAIWAATINNTVSANFVWRERNAYPGELV